MMAAGVPSRWQRSARALSDDLRVGVDTTDAIWSFGTRAWGVCGPPGASGPVGGSKQARPDRRGRGAQNLAKSSTY